MLGIKHNPSFLLLSGAILALASQAEGILNCNSAYSIEAAYKSCLHKEGIDFKVMDHTSASLEDALMSEHSDVFCSYPKETYVSAMECIGGVTRECMPAAYRYLLPVPEKWGQMAVRICDHIDDIDVGCAAKQSHAYKVCGQREAHDFLEKRGSPSNSELACWTFEAEFDCALEVYTSCDCKTAKVYSDMVLEIMMPSTCEQKGELEHNRLVCSADQTLTTTTTPLPALPDHVTANCRTVSKLKKSVVECFTNEGIHNQALFDSYVNSASPPNSLIETLFQQYGDSACSLQRLRFDEALKCTMQLVRDCTPPAYQKYLPRPDTAKAHLDILCEHRKDIDFPCASRKAASLYACAKHKGMNYASSHGSTTAGLYCFAFKAEFECIQEVYKACGCKTAKVYSDLSFHLHYPDTCPKEEIESKRLTCHGTITNDNSIVFDTKNDEPKVTYYEKTGQCMELKKQEIRKCYTNRGFAYYETSRSNLSHIFYGSILDTILSENNVCTNIRSARAAVRCEAEIIQFCLPASDKHDFPDPERLVKILDNLCEARNDIDLACTSRNLREVGHCSITTSANYEFRDVYFPLRNSCRRFRKLGDCAKHTLLTCGCRSAKAYSDTIFNDMLPPECRESRDSPQHMKCDNENPFIYTHHGRDGSGASMVSYTMYSLGIALCLAVPIWRYL